MLAGRSQLTTCAAGEQAASAVLADARTECENGFKQRFPNEGNGDCRVVAVGAVPVGMNGGYVYEATGWYDKSNGLIIGINMLRRICGTMRVHRIIALVMVLPMTRIIVLTRL